MEGNQISRTDPDSLPGSTEPSHHPSLAFAFWVWFVAGGLAIWILPMLTLHTLLGVSPHGRFSVLYSGWVFLVMPAYAVFAFVKVWRTGRSAGILSRWFSRSTVLAVYALVITVPLLQAHHMHGSTVRARVAEGLNMSSPALRAIEIACWDGSLDPTLDHDALRLKAPGDYGGRFTHSVTASVNSLTTARVEIVFKEILTGSMFQRVAVEEGARIIFAFKCADWRTTWALNGEVPKEYIPKRYHGRGN